MGLGVFVFGEISVEEVTNAVVVSLYKIMRVLEEKFTVV